MGTRADFYVGRGRDAEWLGSIAWDGYPSGIPNHIFRAKREDAFRGRVTTFLLDQDDSTFPKDGWPWPWDDSRTTDYAYAFDEGKVWACPFGRGWFDPLEPDADHMQGSVKTAIFPNMSDQQNVAFGPRSGLMIFG